MRGLRKQAARGVIAGIGRKLDQLPASAELLLGSARDAAVSFEYDHGAFADGTYLKALTDAAEEQGVVLVERDGRITCFPLLLKLGPSVPAVRIGRTLERQLRPSALAGLLRRAQEKSAFNAEAFLELLLRAATHLAGGEGRSDEPRSGAVVPLLEIYDLLTLRPGAASDYPREAPFPPRSPGPSAGLAMHQRASPLSHSWGSAERAARGRRPPRQRGGSRSL